MIRKPALNRSPKEWHGRWIKFPSIVVNVTAETAGKAKAIIARKAQEAGYDANVSEIRVRRGQWIDGVSLWL